MASSDFATLNAEVIDSFQTAVTFDPAASAAYAVTGILDGGDQVQAVHPGAHYTLWAPRTSFTTEPLKGDEVIHGGNTYRVADVLREPDDAGGRLLILHYKRP